MSVLKPIASIEVQPKLLVLVSLCLLLVISSCSKVEYRSDPRLVGYTERGIASFYAMHFQFRKTSSGERFNQLALTAAHRTLPFGTKVRVTNLMNNRSVIVKINDRGPFIDKRIIDLSRYAFSKIGDTDSGLINVKIEVIN
jgi:rare lipoprotein A